MVKNQGNEKLKKKLLVHLVFGLGNTFSGAFSKFLLKVTRDLLFVAVFVHS